MLQPIVIRVSERDKKRFRRMYSDRPSKKETQAKFFKELLDLYDHEQAALKQKAV